TATDCAKRSRASTALTRSPDTVLHHLETTGGHAGTAGGCGGKSRAELLQWSLWNITAFCTVIVSTY
ncbi:MAG: hypothetical protein LBD24_04035, partial [Spirochaetaceae bacterium]|nr:hypothetical protein [Spirochaetaceae bacterium]